MRCNFTRRMARFVRLTGNKAGIRYCRRQRAVDLTSRTNLLSTDCKPKFATTRCLTAAPRTAETDASIAPVSESVRNSTLDLLTFLWSGLPTASLVGPSGLPIAPYARNHFLGRPYDRPDVKETVPQHGACACAPAAVKHLGSRPLGCMPTQSRILRTRVSQRMTGFHRFR